MVQGLESSKQKDMGQLLQSRRIHIDKNEQIELMLLLAHRMHRKSNICTDLSLAYG